MCGRESLNGPFRAEFCSLNCSILSNQACSWAILLKKNYKLKQFSYWFVKLFKTSFFATDLVVDFAANKNEEEEDVYLVCICGGGKDGL